MSKIAEAQKNYTRENYHFYGASFAYSDWLITETGKPPEHFLTFRQRRPTLYILWI